MRYAAELEGAGQTPLPPVDKWNPAYGGDIDLVIKRDGAWVYQGTPIRRARLVRLLSTVLKREGERHYLVTPAEKLGVAVEDAPFLAVLMRTEGIGAAGPPFDGENRRIVFTTNVGDEVAAGRDHPLVFRKDPESGVAAPYIEVRAGLEARIARTVFYDLVALGEARDIEGKKMFGVRSNGEFFPFAPASEVFG